jgi:hypothetical protein
LPDGTPDPVESDNADTVDALDTESLVKMALDNSGSPVNTEVVRT